MSAGTFVPAACLNAKSGLQLKLQRLIPKMPDPAEQLQRLYIAGFELETFERFPKAVGVLRDNCIAFLVPGPDGLQILGNVGLRMGESLGPLVERSGRKMFVHKQETVEATPERIAALDKFRADLKAILGGEQKIQ
jgi:hypothetical protein